MVTRPTRITAITDYHWNNALGASPGTIALFSSSGEIFGPWRTSGTPGQGGVPNAYWTVRFSEFLLPPGRYIVVDSDIATWSQNAGTGGAGMVRIEGH